MAEISRANREDPLNLIRIMPAQGTDVFRTLPFLAQHPDPDLKATKGCQPSC